jgi:hypothetical protein
VVAHQGHGAALTRPSDDVIRVGAGAHHVAEGPQGFGAARVGSRDHRIEGFRVRVGVREHRHEAHGSSGGVEPAELADGCVAMRPAR